VNVFALVVPGSHGGITPVSIQQWRTYEIPEPSLAVAVALAEVVHAALEPFMEIVGGVVSHAAVL
jgi:hypothetical protein